MPDHDSTNQDISTGERLPRYAARPAEPPTMGESLRDKSRRYREAPAFFRACWTVLALFAVSIGLAMTAVPGPALLLIPMGIAMLVPELLAVRERLGDGFRRTVDSAG